MRYFTIDEFDSPDKKGSGKNMDTTLLSMLDEARHIAGIPFEINSAYRTEKYNKKLKKKGYQVAKNSSHLKGLAVDIACVGSSNRWKILSALMHVGFNRIGIGKNYLHTDISCQKSGYVIWIYK